MRKTSSIWSGVPVVARIYSVPGARNCTHCACEFRYPIDWKQAETEKLKAIALLDTSGGATPSQWVVDLRAASRYILAAIILIMTAIATVAYVAVPSVQTEPAGWAVDVLLQLSSSVFSFMWGDRVYLSLRKKG